MKPLRLALSATVLGLCLLPGAWAEGAAPAEGAPEQARAGMADADPAEKSTWTEPAAPGGGGAEPMMLGLQFDEGESWSPFSLGGDDGERAAAPKTPPQRLSELLPAIEIGPIELGTSLDPCFTSQP